MTATQTNMDGESECDTEQGNSEQKDSDQANINEELVPKEDSLLSHACGLAIKGLTWSRKPYFANCTAVQLPQQSQTTLTCFTNYARIFSNRIESADEPQLYRWVHKTIPRPVMLQEA